MVDQEIETLSHYLDVLSGIAGRDDEFWFRGHGHLEWKLVPSALRYRSEIVRTKALNLIAQFKRFSEIKIDRPPKQEDGFKWIQIAQHYGLPTRLLDWTENAAIGLYFACLEPQANGLVCVLNPADLNRAAYPKKPWIYDANQDSRLISRYLALSGERDPANGLRTIAVHPTWDSERIMLQRGAFTLHGSNIFSLSGSQVPSLVYVPILKKHKGRLMSQLERIGVSEMSIYPEPEHLCSFLKQVLPSS